MQQNERFFKHYDADFDLLFNDLWTHRLYEWLLRNATHREYEYNGMTLRPGHYVRSVSKLVDDIAYMERNAATKPGRATIKRSIEKLKSLNLIETEYPIKSVFSHKKVGTGVGTDNGMEVGTDNGTLFTVLKMQSQQGFEGDSGKANETEVGTGVGIGLKSEVGSKTRFNKQDLNNKTTTRNRAKRIYENDSDEMKLVDFFIAEIRKNDPKYKEPNKQTWANEFRLLIEKDERDKSEIAKLIRWVQQDDFWKSNVLSAKKLRDKYSTLVIKMNSEPSNAAPEQQSISRPDVMEQGERIDLSEGEDW